MSESVRQLLHWDKYVSWGDNTLHADDKDESDNEADAVVVVMNSLALSPAIIP